VKLPAMMDLDDFHHKEVVFQSGLKKGRVDPGFVNLHTDGLLLVVDVDHPVFIDFVFH
jgi:hypothetical protein